MRFLKNKQKTTKTTKKMNCTPTVYTGVFIFKFPKIEKRRDLVTSIIKIIELETGITYAEMKSKSRLKNIVEARFLAMYALRKNTKLILKDIGSRLNRDHSTVMYALDTISDILSYDSSFRLKILRINECISKIKHA